MTSATRTKSLITKERRDFQRVQDAVGLQIQLLMELPAAGDGLTPLNRKVEKVQVRKKNKYDIKGYAEVKRDHPAVADYIVDLEERIRTLLLRGDEPAEAPTHKVSISASGLAFADDMVLQPGDLIGLKITLFPDLRRIGCDATIISVGDADEVGSGEKHTYRAVFNRITDQDREVIDQHVKSVRKTLPNDGE